MISRRRFLQAVSVSLLAAPPVARAQPAGKVPRVGYLSPGSVSDPVRLRRLEAFRQGLRELGYVEGRNIAVEPRWAEGRYDQYPALVADLVGLKVDIIVAVGGRATQDAQRATKDDPDRHVGRYRSPRERTRFQPCASRWQRHGDRADGHGRRWQTAGDAQGGSSQGVSGRPPLESRQSGGHSPDTCAMSQQGGATTVAIIGAGLGGIALVANLGLQGYRLRLHDIDEARIAKIRERGGLDVEGLVQGWAPLELVTPQLAPAVDGADDHHRGHRQPLSRRRRSRPGRCAPGRSDDPAHPGRHRWLAGRPPRAARGRVPRRGRRGRDGQLSLLAELAGAHARADDDRQAFLTDRLPAGRRGSTRCSPGSVRCFPRRLRPRVS